MSRMDDILKRMINIFLTSTMRHPQKNSCKILPKIFIKEWFYLPMLSSYHHGF